MRRKGEIRIVALATIFAAVLIAGFTACGDAGGGSEGGRGQALAKAGIPPIEGCIIPPEGAFNVDLCAAQEIPTGRVFVWTAETDGVPVLYVQYDVVWPDMLIETRLAVVDDPEDFPLNSQGHPKIGFFPYGIIHSPPVNETTYMIPLSALPTPEAPLYIAAHAVVKLKPECMIETAWGGACECRGEAYGIRFSDSGWATYFAYPYPEAE